MNEREAMELGLTFTGAVAGHYSWEKDKVQTLRDGAKAIKKLGFEAVVVKSLKSEWGGGDYLLYASPEYMEYKRAKSYIYYIQNESQYIQKIREEAEAKIKEIQDKAKEYREACDKYGIQY